MADAIRVVEDNVEATEAWNGPLFDADVLEDKTTKSYRKPDDIEHLGDLIGFGLYDDDTQIEEVRYRFEQAATPSYTVRLWSLEAF